MNERDLLAHGQMNSLAICEQREAHTENRSVCFIQRIFKPFNIYPSPIMHGYLVWTGTMSDLHGTYGFVRQDKGPEQNGI